MRLNWLRAAVLGANDGVVSTAGLVVGVAGATSSASAILTAGLAGLFAGALPMASGEYVSVSSQRDSERALLRLDHHDPADMTPLLVILNKVSGTRYHEPSALDARRRIAAFLHRNLGT